MPKSFHIAMVFFGLIRCGEKSWPSIKTNILDILSQRPSIKFDSFCHTYDLTKINNPRSKEVNVPIQNALHYAQLLGTITLKIENQEDMVDKHLTLSGYTKHGDPWNDDDKSLRNLLRQLHSLREATQLWQNHQHEYYAVVYLRSDLIYYDPIDMQLFNSFLNQNEDRCIIIPKGNDHRGWS